MEFGPREVLIVLGALLVCGIVLDGVRRMRAARRGTLRGPRRQPIFDDEGQDPLHSELPSGGARVVGVRDEEATAEVGKQLWRSPERTRLTTPFRERPEREPVIAGEPAEPPAGSAWRPDPGLDATAPKADPETVANADTDTEPGDEAAMAAAPPAVVEEIQASRPLVPLDAEDLPLFKGEPALPPAPPRRGSRKRGSTNVQGRRKDDPVEAVVLHLMAPTGEAFAARPLFEALQRAGLEFGERNIFHLPAGEGLAPAFSVANAVKPGTFEGKMRDFQTPGVAFFMVVGDTPEPLATFDDMLAAARAVATELGAELCDERRATLTRQGIADYRRRIQDHGRRAYQG